MTNKLDHGFSDSVHRIALVLATLCFLSSCSWGSGQDKERAELHLKIGSGYLTQGLYPQAMSELLRAEKYNPNNVMVLNNLGLAYYVRGRLTQAEQKLRRAIEIEPLYSDAKNNLGRVLLDLGKTEEALKLFHQVEGDLTYVAGEKTFSNLGMAYFNKGLYSKAEIYLLKSLEMRRESCTTMAFYGRVLLAQERLKKSAEALDQAIEFCRQSRFEEPIFYSALSYFRLGEKEKMRARIDELLKDYPKSKYVAKAKGMLELLE